MLSMIVTVTSGTDMSSPLKRQQNRRKRIAQLERMLTFDYTEEQKDRLRQELANEQREQQRFYR